jgi:hypothetical protein
MAPRSMAQRATLASLSILLAAGVSTGAESPKSWVCLGDQAAGFALNEKTHEWQLRAFPPGRYLITRVTDSAIQKYPGYTWEVRDFGAPESAVRAFCKSGFDEKIGDLECSEGIGVRFLFNRQTLRFTLFSAPAGYINYGAADLGALPPPTIEIGRCSAV